MVLKHTGKHLKLFYVLNYCPCFSYFDSLCSILEIRKYGCANYAGNSTQIDCFQTSFGLIIEFPDKNRPHLVLATATGRKEVIYDVILLEYLATGCYRCYSSQGVYL